MYEWVAESTRGRGSSDWTPWHWAMTGLALYAVLVGFFVGRKLTRRSEEAFIEDPSNPKAFKLWEIGHLIRLASAEAVAVWGAAVRILLGEALWQASFFYAAGLFLLLLWTPRMGKPAKARLSTGN